jgi:mannosyltransferase
MAAGLVAVAAGVVLRFWAPSALWLDEAISVNIAKLPVTQIPRALSHDGAPPLYYVLLHYWMDLFGRSDVAVRALSGVISVISLPVFWIAGRRLGGRTVAWVTFFLALSSPFAINYATTARMYSLMILLSLLGFVALSAAYEAPTPRRLMAVGAVTAALLYTHYWGLYLVLVAAGWLLWRIRRTGQGRPALRAMAVGCLLWVPWAPVFAYQTLHTGTPWTSAASPGDLLKVFQDWSGGGPWGGLLMYAMFLLFVIGTFGRTAAPGTMVTLQDADGRTRQVEAGPAVVIELTPRPGMAPMVGIAVATLVVAVALGALANAAFVARYTAVVLPLFLLVMSVGVAVIPGPRFRTGGLAVLVLAGILTGQSANAQHRTQAVQVASVLNAQAAPGDLVVYCPDQLGPSVDRLLTVQGLQEITFPRATGPQRVNWVDYKKVIASTNVSQFTQNALSTVTANHTVWLVWRDGYPALGGDCGYVKSWLDLFRQSGVTLVHANSSTYFEFENLTRYAG